MDYFKWERLGRQNLIHKIKYNWASPEWEEGREQTLPSTAI